MTCCGAVDITGGRERCPVTCNNEYDDEPFPGSFEYIVHAAEQLRLSGASGCSCPGRCTSASGCSCDGEAESSEGLWIHGQECGSACSCGPGCSRRTTQQGLAIPVLLCKATKGWSAHAGEAVQQGAFVACYVGEQLNSRAAEERLRAYDRDREGHALLVAREYLPSGACLRLNIDATRVGNVARFFNHSCDGGNLALEIVRSRGDLLPRVALVAARDIAASAELTFSYGAPSAGPATCESSDAAASPRRCLCGTPACLGFLPRGGC